MCETCGCGNKDGYRIVDPGSGEFMHEHGQHGPHSHSHTHEPGHDHPHEHTHHKTINLNVDILADNNRIAALNRRFLEGRKVLCLNMVSSPGSGKTTILEKTIPLLKDRKVYVIEGDQQTTLDAERIRKAGAYAIQVNTGSGCHLDAKMVESALKKMNIEANSILLIENVGNLVCPAMFDLGETRRVLVMSVTEGEEKPLKYPAMFETSHLCIINKSDLIPHVDFNKDEFIKNALHINPHLELIELSAKNSDGMNNWFDWIINKNPAS